MSEESVTVESGPTEGPGADDLVSIPDATDDEIRGYLDRAVKEESQGLEPQPEQQQVEAKKETEQPQVDPPKEEKPEPPTVNVEQENLKLRAQLQQQEEFIKRRSTEIGQLRKELREAKARIELQAKEVEVDNPREAAKLDREFERLDAEERRLEGQAEQLDRLREAATIIPRYVKPEEMDVVAMKQELLEDGLPANFVEDFATNPLLKAAPETIIHLAKRAHYGKALRQLVPYTQSLQKEVLELRAKLGKAGEEVVNGIKRELNRPQPLTASVSVADGSNRTPVVDPYSMSDAEIKAYLAKNRG